MARVVAVVSQKGGVGKTTTAVNLAAAFAREGREVLLIEVDAQGAVLPSLGCEATQARHSLLDVLSDASVDAAEAVVATDLEGVSAMAAVSGDDVDAEIELERLALAHPMLLRDVLDHLSARYDFVLLDGPPTLGPLTRTCLAAADSFLVPVQAEEYSVRTLPRLMQTVEEIRRTLNPDLACEGLLLTMVDLRTRMSVRTVNHLHENYGDQVLESMVPRTVTVQDMPVVGKPTVIHAASSRGGRAYTEVAQELVSNLRAQEMAEPLLQKVAEGLASAAQLARAGEAAVRDPKPAHEIREETMISQFPSTWAGEGRSNKPARWDTGLDDLYTAWSDGVDDDPKIN